MAQRIAPPFRADHVGSFLRPAKLLEARERFQKGALAREQLRAAEDEAIRDVVRLQEDVGLQGITDGEFRRTYFHRFPRAPCTATTSLANRRWRSFG